MDEQKRRERSLRVQRMNAVLRTLFPEVRIALRYSTDFECLVAVILSAQCTDARVNMVTPELFRAYPRIEDYAVARPRDMERIIFSCGFYHSKALYIIGAAQKLLERFEGKLPRSIDELRTLPGVARKTANVVLSTLYGIAEGIAVDTHVRRFAIRFDLTDHTDPIRIERDLMAIMPQTEWWGFNHRLVHYGRSICPARPHDCQKHPLTIVYPPAGKRFVKAR